MRMMLGHLGLYPRVDIAEDLQSYLEEVVKIDDCCQRDALYERLQIKPDQQYRVVHAWRQIPPGKVVCALRRFYAGSNERTLFLDAELLLVLGEYAWEPILEKKVIA